MFVGVGAANENVCGAAVGNVGDGGVAMIDGENVIIVGSRLRVGDRHRVRHSLR
jgi:hypothetical protein